MKLAFLVCILCVFSVAVNSEISPNSKRALDCSATAQKDSATTACLDKLSDGKLTACKQKVSSLKKLSWVEYARLKCERKLAKADLQTVYICMHNALQALQQPSTIRQLTSALLTKSKGMVWKCSKMI